MIASAVLFTKHSFIAVIDNQLLYSGWQCMIFPRSIDLKHYPHLSKITLHFVGYIHALILLDICRAVLIWKNAAAISHTGAECCDMQLMRYCTDSPFRILKNTITR